MNNKAMTKTDHFLILCIIVSVIIAAFATILEKMVDQIEQETDPVETVVSEPVPEQASVSEGTERIFPDQEFYISGWDTCLDQLNIDADVVFLGDSITFMSSFDDDFPELKICNLGVWSDTIKGVNYRTGTLRTVRPEKVFLLIGINSLKNDNIDECLEDYTALVDNIRSAGDFELYLMSVLPVADSFAERKGLYPDTIVSFNEKIAELAKEKDAVYLDLYSQLEESAYIKPEYTADGLHLSDEAYAVWADYIKPYIDQN